MTIIDIKCCAPRMFAGHSVQVLAATENSCYKVKSLRKSDAISQHICRPTYRLMWWLVALSTIRSIAIRPRASLKDLMQPISKKNQIQISQGPVSKGGFHNLPDTVIHIMANVNSLVCLVISMATTSIKARYTSAREETSWHARGVVIWSQLLYFSGTSIRNARLI